MKAEREKRRRRRSPALPFSVRERRGHCMPEQRVYEVSQVNEYIKSLLDNAPGLGNLYVRGELSNYKIYPSGHHYFTMKDGNGALRCVMFRSSASRLRFRPENGMKVVARGRISVFPRDGAYQLYCSELSPDGIGDLYVAFEQLKAKLLAEGLFEQSHKKRLPPYPEKIAVITSSAGAAVHDMIRILRRRYPIAEVALLPVRVQGAEAPSEIAGAIRYANRWKVGDLIITGRGGGSIEDLWAFNDERVARAIYDSELPVISAVGHEPDVTISDFVADARASTPSNAAEIAVPDQAELLRWLQGTLAGMSKAEAARIENCRVKLRNLAEKRVMTDQMAYVQDRRMELLHVQQRLGDVGGRILSHKREKFSALSASLDAMSPLKVLGRGYAIVQTENGGIVKSWREAPAGSSVCVKLGKGGLACKVEKSYQEEQ